MGNPEARASITPLSPPSVKRSQVAVFQSSKPLQSPFLYWLCFPLFQSPVPTLAPWDHFPHRVSAAQDLSWLCFLFKCSKCRGALSWSLLQAHSTNLCPLPLRLLPAPGSLLRPFQDVALAKGAISPRLTALPQPTSLTNKLVGVKYSIVLPQFETPLKGKRFPWDPPNPLLELHHTSTFPSAPSCFPHSLMGVVFENTP